MASKKFAVCYYTLLPYKFNICQIWVVRLLLIAKQNGKMVDSDNDNKIYKFMNWFYF